MMAENSQVNSQLHFYYDNPTATTTSKGQAISHKNQKQEITSSKSTSGKLKIDYQDKLYYFFLAATTSTTIMTST